MSPRSTSTVRGYLPLFGLVALLATPAFAQPTTPPGQAKKPDPVQQAQDLASYRAGMANAFALAKAGNLTAAEAALDALNKSKPNTATWHLETAHRLTQLAEQLARAGLPANVPALANSALAHVTQAQPLASDARTKASAKTLEGTIYEQYLSNSTAALTAYQAAAQLSPDTAAKAKEASDRLQKAKDHLAAKNDGK